MIQKPPPPKIGDTAPCRGHIELSTNLLEQGLDPKEVSHRQVSKASENTLFGRHISEI